MDPRKPPYFAVIFTSLLAPGQEGYEEAAQRMVELVREQPGFLGFDSARGSDGVGITVSYWASRESIRKWKAVAEHREVQARGRAHWYSSFRIRIAEITEDRIE